MTPNLLRVLSRVQVRLHQDGAEGELEAISRMSVDELRLLAMREIGFGMTLDVPRVVHSQSTEVRRLRVVA